MITANALPCVHYTSKHNHDKSLLVDTGTLFDLLREHFLFPTLSNPLPIPRHSVQSITTRWVAVYTMLSARLTGEEASRLHNRDNTWQFCICCLGRQDKYITVFSAFCEVAPSVHPCNV